MTDSSLIPAPDWGGPRTDITSSFNIDHHADIPFTRSAALKAVGEVVYANLMADGTVKIGWTRDLYHRLRCFPPGSRLLAFRVGDHQDELDIHHGLKAHVARGREYYHPLPEVVALINEWRKALGQPEWMPDAPQP
jgi:hypothetical protein